MTTLKSLQDYLRNFSNKQTIDVNNMQNTKCDSSKLQPAKIGNPETLPNTPYFKIHTYSKEESDLMFDSYTTGSHLKLLDEGTVNVKKRALKQITQLDIIFVMVTTFVLKMMEPNQVLQALVHPQQLIF